MDGWTAVAGAVADGQIVYAAVVVLVIGLILTGKLVWHTTADRWYTAWLEDQKVKAELMKQNSALIEAGRTTTRVIESLPKVGGDTS